MTDETVKPVQPVQPVKKRIILKRPKPPEREQSTIGFPYNDLDTAISVARAILNAGAVALTREQLAGLMDTTTSSGTYLNKLSATRMFGLITMSLGKIELTDLGFAILDTDERRQRKARADAFLSVPLFRKLYDDFRGRQLPPRPFGLETAILKYGVSPNQKTTARLTFDRSAASAGFFPNGNDRLIEPIIGGGTLRAETVADREDMEVAELPITKSRTPEKPDLPHFMHMLIDALPAVGTTWTVDGRAKWLQAAATAFDLSYKGDGSITIQAKAAPDAEAKKEG